MLRSNRVTLSSNGNYWQAFYIDLNGKRRAKSLGSKKRLSRRQANVLCDRLANELERSPTKYTTGPAPHLAEYLEGYFASRTDLEAGSIYLQRLTGRYLLEFFGGHMRIDRITRAMASSWRSALARGELKKARKNHQYQTMSETTVCGRVRDAKTIFNAAVRDDQIPFNPFDRLKRTPPDPDKNWFYLSMEQLDQLLDACPDTGWKLLLALCRLAGLRRGEARNLKWSDVDFEKRRLTVIAKKTKRKRIIPIDPKLYRMLLEGFSTAGEGDESVCNVCGHDLWRNFRVIRNRAGLPQWDDAFQTLRRNRETDWAGEYPQHAVSEWMGHDITISAKYYLQIPEQLYIAAATAAEK